MKYENLLKIHIPEPCHEDWNKMTPNEQGAFCKVCCKTVVDFSDKSDEEIQQFLAENINNSTCGRFRKSQLEETPRLKIEKPKFIFPGFLMPVITPFRAYAMALMLFASAALSSCGNSNTGGGGGDEERLAGAVELVNDSTCKNNYDDRIAGKILPRNRTDTIKTDTVYNFNDDRIQGGVRPYNVIDSLQADTTDEMLQGEIQKKEDKTMGIYYDSK